MMHAYDRMTEVIHNEALIDLEGGLWKFLVMDHGHE